MTGTRRIAAAIAVGGAALGVVAFATAGSTTAPSAKPAAIRADAVPRIDIPLPAKVTIARLPRQRQKRRATPSIQQATVSVPRPTAIAPPPPVYRPPPAASRPQQPQYGPVVVAPPQ